MFEPTLAYADAVETKGNRYIELRNDNDFWIPAGTDRYYTNGLFAKFMYPGEGPWWPGFMDGVFAFAGGCGEEDECSHKSRGYAVNQYMYTPRNIEETVFIDDDHPYGGFLSLSYMLFADHMDREGCRTFGACVFNEFEIQLGAIGKNSLARDAHVWWHTRVLGIQRPNGWDNQLRSGVGGLVRMQRGWPVRGDIAGLSFEFKSYAELAAGNVALYALAGAQVKLGTDPNEEPGRGRWAEHRRASWTVFAGVSGTAVGKNLFVSGRTRASDQTLPIRHAVGEVQFGGAIRFGFLRTSLTVVAQSKQFPQQRLGHLYGVARLGFVY